MNSQLYIESKAPDSLMILSYAEAYKRLIRFINEYYWSLEKIPPRPGVPTSPLALYKAKKEGQVYKVRFFGPGSAGEDRLNRLLVNIHATQDTKTEGCRVLIRWLDEILVSKKGFYFPGGLAKQVENGLFSVSASGENCISLSGSAGLNVKMEMDHFYQNAKKRNKEYSGSSSNSSSAEPDIDSLLLIAALR